MIDMTQVNQIAFLFLRTGMYFVGSCNAVKETSSKDLHFLFS